MLHTLQLYLYDILERQNCQDREQIGDYKWWGGEGLVIKGQHQGTWGMEEWFCV